jgi:hypothetical protein
VGGTRTGHARDLVIGCADLFVFAATITAQGKPGFTCSINRGELISVVATQPMAVFMPLLVDEAPATAVARLFGASCLNLLGAAFYLPIIALVE